MGWAFCKFHSSCTMFFTKIIFGQYALEIFIEMLYGARLWEFQHESNCNAFSIQSPIDEADINQIII